MLVTMDSSGWYPGGAAAVVPGWITPECFVHNPLFFFCIFDITWLAGKTGPWRALGPGEQRKGPVRNPFSMIVADISTCHHKHEFLRGVCLDVLPQALISHYAKHHSLCRK